MRYITIVLILCGTVFGQSWSGIVAPARIIDYSTAGLPATLPDGETTPNPWTPPSGRTQCVTAACNTVSGGSVTATTVNAAIASASAGTYVLLPSGTFNCGGQINLNVNYVTLRGAGADSTKLTGCSILLGRDFVWGGASFLTANPARFATSITVAAPPTAGRLAMIEQCDDGFSSSDAAGMTHFSGPGYANPCTGSYSDPHGPWWCSLASICDGNGGGTPNPHFQSQVIWIPAGGVSGNTVNFSGQLWNDNWKTSKSAVLTWLSTAGVVGVGVEELSIDGGGIDFEGTYASWMKGIREISTTSALILTDVQYSDHTLLSDSYIVETQTSTGNYLVRLGFDGGEAGQSNLLFINNILEGGFIAGFGSEVGNVYAFFFERNGGNSAFMQNTTFEHHGGVSFVLREGFQGGRALDDITWATHNFTAFFRNFLNCTDPDFGGSSPFAIGVDGFARNATIIGNALGGGSGCGSSYSSIMAINRGGGTFNTSGDTTGLTTASAMIWGNYTACTGDPHCNTTGAGIFSSADVPSNLSSFGSNATPYQNSVPASTNLPASFFMNNMIAHPSGGTGLRFWKACDSWTTFPTTCAHFTTQPFPIAGPDITGGPYLSGHAYDTPAAIVWAGLPTDPAYTTAWGRNAKRFTSTAFTLDASANAPGIALSPAPGFGTQKINTTSAGQNITVTSNGTLNLLITNITKAGTNPGDFAMSDNCPRDPTPLAPTQTCTITITFTPTATGARSATITVTSNAPTSPDSSTPTGTGTAPVASLTPSSTNFGNVTVGTDSGIQSFLLSNTGDAVLAISSSALTGADITQYVITSNTCGATLAASGSCNINVKCHPLSTGLKNAFITVTDDAAGSPHSSTLACTGVPVPSPSTTITTGGGVSIKGGVVLK